MTVSWFKCPRSWNCDFHRHHYWLLNTTWASKKFPRRSVVSPLPSPSFPPPPPRPPAVYYGLWPYRFKTWCYGPASSHLLQTLIHRTMAYSIENSSKSSTISICRLLWVSYSLRKIIGIRGFFMSGWFYIIVTRSGNRKDSNHMLLELYGINCKRYQHTTFP